MLGNAHFYLIDLISIHLCTKANLSIYLSLVGMAARPAQRIDRMS